MFLDGSWIFLVVLCCFLGSAILGGRTVAEERRFPYAN